MIMFRSFYNIENIEFVTIDRFHLPREIRLKFVFFNNRRRRYNILKYNIILLSNINLITFACDKIVKI